MKKLKNLIGFLMLLFCLACQRSSQRVVVVQPLGDFDTELKQHLLVQLKKNIQNVVIRPSMAMPANAYYVPRNRYRADSLLRLLKTQIGADSVVVAITHFDISTTNGKQKDWGVMGLGYRPGNACVVSTFRLNQRNLSEQFYKVILHELGHTEGLDHCKVKTCLMRDAEGGNPLNEEKEFCQKCKKHLQKQGWSLPEN